MVIKTKINLPEERIDAYELLKLLKTECDFKEEPPIDVEAIAYLLGIEIIEDLDINFINDIGYIKVENSKPLIWLNPYENRNENRRRFTIAHELGHFCLHILPNKKDGMFVDTEENFSRNAYWDIKELQANKFAANLLMPVWLIRNKGLEVIKEFEDKYKEPPTIDIFIDIMAKVFKVSRQAMKYRLINLGAIKP